MSAHICGHALAMSEAMIVCLADVRAALARALNATQDRLGAEVSLESDCYRHLPVQDAFDIASEPKTFTVGQVSDDLDESMRDDRPHLPEEAWHDLSHLIGVPCAGVGRAVLTTALRLQSNLSAASAEGWISNCWDACMSRREAQVGLGRGWAARWRARPCSDCAVGTRLFAHSVMIGR